MGCDMHCVIERRNDSGKWEVIKGYDRYLLTCRKRNQVPELNYKELISDWVYDGRSYELFATLAGVRNECGITPMFENRGVPEDAAKETKELIGDYKPDGHSHTYFTLYEFVETLFEGFVVYVGNAPLQQFINTVIVKMVKLSRHTKNGEKDVRLVIFFDS